MQRERERERERASTCDCKSAVTLNNTSNSKKECDEDCTCVNSAEVTFETLPFSGPLGTPEVRFFATEFNDDECTQTCIRVRDGLLCLCCPGRYSVTLLVRFRITFETPPDEDLVLTLLPRLTPEGCLTDNLTTLIPDIQIVVPAGTTDFRGNFTLPLKVQIGSGCCYRFTIIAPEATPFPEGAVFTIEPGSLGNVKRLSCVRAVGRCMNSLVTAPTPDNPCPPCPPCPPIPPGSCCDQIAALPTPTVTSVGGVLYDVDFGGFVAPVGCDFRVQGVNADQTLAFAYTVLGGQSFDNPAVPAPSITPGDVITVRIFPIPNPLTQTCRSFQVTVQ